MPAKTKTVKGAPGEPRALFENERIVHLKGCKEISACACPVLNQYNLPLDTDHNCVCLESLTPHAQHAPAQVLKQTPEGR